MKITLQWSGNQMDFFLEIKMMILLVALPSSTAGTAHTQKKVALLNTQRQAGPYYGHAWLTFLCKLKFCHLFSQGKMYTALNIKKIISTLQRHLYE